MPVSRPSASLLLAGLLALLLVGTASPAAANGVDHRSLACSPGAAATEGTSAGGADVSIETLVAPGASYDQLTSPAALRAARANGTLVPASRGIDRTYVDALVAFRDVTVHRIALEGNATALADRLAAGDGSSPTQRFRTLVANGTVGFEYWGPSACPPELALNATVDHNALRVLPNTDNDTVALVWDTDRLRFHPLDGGEPTTDTRVHGRHRFGLRLPGTGAFVTDTVGDEVGYEVRTGHAELAAHHEGLVRVDADDGQRLRGRTTLAPGSELTVRLVPYVGAGETEVATTTIDRNRTFVARFDLSEATNRTVYAVQFESITTPPVVEAGATFVAVGNATGAIVDARNQTSNGEILYGPTITTTGGGFVTVRNASGGLVGVSDYRTPGAAVAQIDLEPALQSSQHVTVTVYRDVNGNRAFDDGDEPYRVAGSPVRDTAIVELHRDDTPSDPPSPTSTRTPTPVPTTETTTASTTTTSPGQPGFGMGLAALGVLVSLAFRRHR